MTRFVELIYLGLCIITYQTETGSAWILTTPAVATNTRRTTDSFISSTGSTIRSLQLSTTGSSGRSSKILSALSAPSYESTGSSSSGINSNNNNNESSKSNTQQHSNLDHVNSGNHISLTTTGAAAAAAGGSEGGRILEGGKIIDFSSVKASSKAETALAEARLIVLQQQQQQQQVTASSSNQLPVYPNGDLYFATDEQQQPTQKVGGDAILGINQDVIDQVGHDLGTFCSAQEVQECAAYVRSNAPSGLLSDTDMTNTFVPQYLPSDIARYEAIISQAYDEAGEVTSAFAKTFYMGTMLMSENARRAIWAVYVWCRRTDEIVDAPRDSNDDMLLDLSLWEMRLEQLWQSGIVVDVYDLCLLHTRIQYPTMDIQPFMDMIRGMLMDVPDLGTERYENFDELHLYCYRVAGTVGVMSLPVFGCAPGYDEDIAREPALSLGVAFQLTNILRDVGEDARERGRIYLPREDMAHFNVSEEQIFAQIVDDNYRSMMKFQIARARMYYERARRGVFMLAEESRLPVQTSLDAYGRILDKIEENNYDSLTKRAYVDKWEKLSIIPFSWYRTTDVSRTFPLPGDQPVDLNIA